MELRQAALAVLQLPTRADKCAAVKALTPNLFIDNQKTIVVTTKIPVRENLPHLVPPTQLRKRSLATLQGRAIFLHALAHIEMNAVDLALDVIWRFKGLPFEFYQNWLQVAQEEVLHFELLNSCLQEMGYVYGDFPAHNGLWEIAERTADDLLARLALIPRHLEARGLDVTPAMRAKFTQVGLDAVVKALNIIERDEIGHVAIGNRWFHYLCQQQGIGALETFQRLLQDYAAPAMRPPFNWEARQAAGFTADELAWLASLNPPGVARE